MRTEYLNQCSLSLSLSFPQFCLSRVLVAVPIQARNERKFTFDTSSLELLPKADKGRSLHSKELHNCLEPCSAGTLNSFIASAEAYTFSKRFRLNPGLGASEENSGHAAWVDCFGIYACFGLSWFND